MLIDVTWCNVMCVCAIRVGTECTRHVCVLYCKYVYDNSLGQAGTWYLSVECSTDVRICARHFAF